MFKLQGERDWEKQVEKEEYTIWPSRKCLGAFRKDPIKGHEPSRKALNETQVVKVSGRRCRARWGWAAEGE